MTLKRKRDARVYCPMPLSVSELKDRHAGRPAVVMGGAPSLPEALKHCPKDAVYISANQHGAMLRKVDYIVHTDRVQQTTNLPMRMLLKKYGAPLVSPQPDADYILENNIEANSGIRAILFAGILGCNPIIVTGIEMYQGDTYFHDLKARSSGFDKDPDKIRAMLDELVVITSHLNIKQIMCNLPFPEYGYPTVTPSEKAIPRWDSRT